MESANPKIYNMEDISTFQQPIGLSDGLMELPGIFPVYSLITKFLISPTLQFQLVYPNSQSLNFPFRNLSISEKTT